MWWSSSFPGVNHPTEALDVCEWAAADLFDELPPVVHKWPAPPPRICRQPWPLYTSAGISLCVIPGGKLQLLVLWTREKTRKATDKVSGVEQELHVSPSTDKRLKDLSAAELVSSVTREVKFTKHKTWRRKATVRHFPSVWKFTNSLVTCSSMGSPLLILFWLYTCMTAKGQETLITHLTSQSEERFYWDEWICHGRCCRSYRR